MNFIFEDIIQDESDIDVGDVTELLKEAHQKILDLQQERNLYKRDAAERYADAKRFARTIQKIYSDPDKARKIIKGLHDFEDDLVEYGLTNGDAPDVTVTDVEDGI